MIHSHASIKCPLCNSELFELNENYHQCTCCALAVSRKPSGTYDETYYYGSGGWNRDLALRAKKLFGAASGFLRQDKHILDFGCNIGIFADYCNRRNYRVDGVDISGRSIEYCKNHAKGNFYAPGELRIKYDMVTAFDVIEHFDDMDAFMKEAGSCLNEKGHLMITTPNINSQWIRYFGFGWHGFGIPQYHRYILSKKALEILAERHGYRMVHFESRGILGSHGWKYAVSSAYRLKKNKIQKLMKIPEGVLKYLLLVIRQQYGTDTIFTVLQKGG